jgi:hypothetical protein
VSSHDGQLRDRQAAGHLTDGGDGAIGQVEDLGDDQPADDEDERAGNLRRGDVEHENDGEGDGADEQRRGVQVAEPAEPTGELLPAVRALGVRAGELGQLADDDVDGGAEEEAGDHRLRQEP